MIPTSFNNRDVTLRGVLHVPADFDKAQSYAAMVIATPGSSVKEQIGAVYASRMAARGFVVITFDPSYQGESGGELRDLEDPAVRAEDIRCALDHLTTLPYVDEARIGLLGICAGGGYAVQAALTDHRFRAIGTVVANDLGRAFRGMPPGGDILQFLQELGRQRTAEARGAPLRRDPWIPDSMTDARDAGMTDQELLEAVQFYRESPFRHARSTNRLLHRSYSHILAFDAFNLVPDLLVQPLQVVVGGRRGKTGQYEAGHLLLDLSPATEKNIFVVEDAGHYDLYHKPEYVDPVVDRLAQFFSRHLSD